MKRKPTARTRSYRVWVPEEEAALHRGVAKYGVGLWSEIIHDPEFSILSGFTGVQLKDKWRNIIKFKHATVAADIPAELTQELRRVGDQDRVAKTWTSDEEAELAMAVDKLGSGDWSVVRSDVEFPLLRSFTPAQLRDKWQSMQHTPRSEPNRDAQAYSTRQAARPVSSSERSDTCSLPVEDDAMADHGAADEADVAKQLLMLSGANTGAQVGPAGSAQLPSRAAHRARKRRAAAGAIKVMEDTRYSIYDARRYAARTAALQETRTRLLADEQDGSPMRIHRQQDQGAPDSNPADSPRSAPWQDWHTAPTYCLGDPFWDVHVPKRRRSERQAARRPPPMPRQALQLGGQLPRAPVWGPAGQNGTQGGLVDHTIRHIVGRTRDVAVHDRVSPDALGRASRASLPMAPTHLQARNLLQTDGWTDRRSGARTATPVGHVPQASVIHSVLQGRCSSAGPQGTLAPLAEPSQDPRANVLANLPPEVVQQLVAALKQQQLQAQQYANMHALLAKLALPQQASPPMAPAAAAQLPAVHLLELLMKQHAESHAPLQRTAMPIELQASCGTAALKQEAGWGHMPAAASGSIPRTQQPPQHFPSTTLKEPIPVYQDPSPTVQVQQAAPRAIQLLQELLVKQRLQDALVAASGVSLRQDVEPARANAAAQTAADGGNLHPLVRALLQRAPHIQLQ